MTPDDLAALLLEHRDLLAGEDGRGQAKRAVIYCRCGEWVEATRGWDEDRFAHARHQATMVLAAAPELGTLF